MSEWISVKDRMPEDIIPIKHGECGTKQIKVIVYCVSDSGHKTITTMLRQRNRWYKNGGGWAWGKYLAGEITHWMPLPKPPKEVQKNETNQCG